MKIDILHYSVPPVVGGVESVIASHARLMADAGHTVRLIAGRGSQMDNRIPFIQIPLVDSLDSQVLRIKNSLDQGKIPPDFESTVVEINNQLTDLTVDTDILVAHNVCSLHKNLALTAAIHRLLQSGHTPRLILWHHDLAWTALRYHPELHSGFPWELLRQAWPGATQVVVSAFRQVELAALTGIDAEQIQVIPNGIDPAEFLKLDGKTRQLVNEHHLMDALPFFLLPVRITPRKNIELALHIVRELRDYFPLIKLVVSGPPGPHNPANLEYFNRLRSLRHELDLVGTAIFLAENSSTYLPDEVIFDLYRLADALLLPSREEGFGIPLIEAGMAGIPIFCADIPSLREAGGRSAAYFHPEDDPAVIANLIQSELEYIRSFEYKMKIKNTFTWEHIYQDKISKLLAT